MAEPWLWKWSRDKIATAVLAWGLPIVTPIAYGLWAYFNGQIGPNFLLGLVVAIGVPTAAVMTVRSHILIARTMAEIRATALEYQTQRASQGPTVEIMEQWRRDLMTKREGQIASWRAMVYEIHKALQVPAAAGKSATPLLEQHQSFLTFRSVMSAPTKAALYGPAIVPPPPQSTMTGTLHFILEDIDRTEKEWSLI